jgi:hypothetical protein
MPKLPKEVNTMVVLKILQKNIHGVKEKVPQCGGWKDGKNIKITCHHLEFCYSKSDLTYPTDIININ